MTKEEAVKLLQVTRLMLMDGANQPISDLYYALDMAIEALEQTEPTISKMEQVDTMSCQECKHFQENAVMYLDQCDFCFKDCKYEPKERTEREGE